MGNFNITRLPIIVLLLTLFASGCASFPGRELPIYMPEQVQAPAKKIAVTYDAKAFVLGRENKVMTEGLSKELQETLGASPLIATAATGTGPDDYHYSFVLRDEGNEALAFLSGFISGFTLGVIPGYGRDNYTLAVDVKQGDRLLKTYTYRDHMDSWIQIFLIVMTPSHWPPTIAQSIFHNMIMNFLHDFAADLQSGVPLAGHTVPL